MNNLPRISARVINSIPVQELWENLEGSFILFFDDGEELVTNERETIISHYIWRYHREYPQLPLLAKHHLQKVLKGKYYGTMTHSDMIQKILWETYDLIVKARSDKEPAIDRLGQMSYEISNDLYNDTSVQLEEYVLSLDILDFLELEDDEIINAAKVKVTSNLDVDEEGLEELNRTIMRQVNNKALFVNNPMVKVLRGKLTRENQFLQCMGARGFIKEIDQIRFNKAVTVGFFDGITKLSWSMMETRSATFSLINSTGPLEESEYFSRRQQLICMNVRTLHREDCGSNKYIQWPVKGPKVVDGQVVKAGDLETSLPGKIYLNEETGMLTEIRSSDLHLEGQTIKLRSVVAGCNHPDPYGVCEVCYGTLGDSIPANSNLGHINCVTLTSEMGQLILSTKHYLGSAVVEGIQLRPDEKRFLTAHNNGNRYFLNSGLDKKKLKLRFAQHQFTGITDLTMVEDVKTLNPPRISELSHVGFLTDFAGSEELVSMPVQVGQRYASITHALLRHIKEKGYTLDDKTNSYSVDMEGWDYKQPAFVLPMREASTSDHQGEIAKLLEATVKDLEERSDRVDPADMLMEFHDLVTKKIQMPLPILEIILYSSMVQSATKMNYGLPKGYTESGLGVMRKLLTSRSLSAAMAFQGHREIMTDPAQYIHTNRPDHIADGLLMPEEVFGFNAYYGPVSN